MENWNKRFLLVAGGAIGCLFTAQVYAQDDPVEIIDADLDRRVVEPRELDTENFEVGAYYGILSIQDFSSTEVIGVRLAYHVTEDFFFEASYGMAEGDLTSYEKLSGGSPLFSDTEREYTYYDVSIGWNFLPGELFILDDLAFNTQLYTIVGVGNTEFAQGEWFTVNLGIGARVLLTDWLAWHLDFRDHIFDRDTFLEEETTHNLEFHTSFTVFF